MNLLYTKARYDDIIKVYNKALTIPSNYKMNAMILELYLDALIEKVQLKIRFILVRLVNDSSFKIQEQSRITKFRQASIRASQKRP